MAAAIFGLLGVVAGGLITYWTQLATAQRQERARTVAAARILSVELRAVQGVLAAASLGSTLARLRAERVFDAWTEYREDLAHVSDWDALAAVMVQLAALAPVIADEPVTEGSVSGLQRAIGAALRTLEAEVTITETEP